MYCYSLSGPLAFEPHAHMQSGLVVALLDQSIAPSLKLTIATIDIRMIGTRLELRTTARLIAAVRKV